MEFLPSVNRTKRLDEHGRPFFEITIRDKNSTFQLGATISAYEALLLFKSMKLELSVVFDECDLDLNAIPPK